MWWLLAIARAGTDHGCAFLVDGAPTERLDCAAGGAWVVRCVLPEDAGGKLRIRASLPGLGLSGEARVPLGRSGTIEIPLSGPGGRSGGFFVERAGAGLLPGQALGPNQWCPVVQPGAVPGAPRAELPIEVVASVHRQTGFGEEVLAGGVVNRVPVYDAGEVKAWGRAVTVQRAVGTVPVLEGPVPVGPEPVRGRLSVAGADGTWRTLGWSGSIEEIAVSTGEVRVLVLDFVAPEVEAAAGGDPVAWIRADLQRWLTGDDSTPLGLAAWARSELVRPTEVPSWQEGSVGGRGWTIGRATRSELRVGRFGDRLRAVIAWRAAPWDASALAAAEAGASRGL